MDECDLVELTRDGAVDDLVEPTRNDTVGAILNAIAVDMIMARRRGAVSNIEILLCDEHGLEHWFRDGWWARSLAQNWAANALVIALTVTGVEILEKEC